MRFLGWIFGSTPLNRALLIGFVLGTIAGVLTMRGFALLVPLVYAVACVIESKVNE